VSEFCLRFGANHSIQITLLQPLFEEANRFRQILVGVMRALDHEGIGSSLPDWPGTGESLIDIDAIRLADWRTALSGTGGLVASFRAAALIDSAADAKAIWRFAPEQGQRLVRDLRRTQLTASVDDTPAGCERVAGNIVQTSFLEELAALSPASHAAVRTLRLESDVAEADAKLPGTPVWRRSEPSDDPALREAITQDLILWARACAAS
jgi:hypothetical protein